MVTQRMRLCHRASIWIGLGSVVASLLLPLLFFDGYCQASVGFCEQTAAELIITALLTGCVVDNRGRYCSELSLHRWTWRYVLLCILKAAPQLVWVLPVDTVHDVDIIRYGVRYRNVLYMACYLSSITLLSYLTLLKLRLIVAGDAPCATCLFRSSSTMTAGGLL